MADNIVLPATGSGDTTPIVATEDISGAQHQLVKVEFGLDGVATKVSESNPLPVASRQGLNPAAPTFATVGVGDGTVVAGNPLRAGLVLVNTTAGLISIAFGAAAVLGSGITLAGNGGAFVMDAYTFTTSEVHAIAQNGSSNLSIQEFSTL